MDAVKSNASCQLCFHIRQFEVFSTSQVELLPEDVLQVDLMARIGSI